MARFCQRCGKKLSLFSGSSTYCSDCTQQMLPRCSTCNSPVEIVKCSSGASGYRLLEAIPEYVNARVCRKCMRANVDLNQIPDESMSVFIGRVVRTDREKYDKRIVQIQTNYPQNVAEKILRFPFYYSIRKGDRVAIAGRPSGDLIEPILIRNMSAKSEKPGGGVVDKTGLGKHGRRSLLVIDSPVALKARMKIDSALKAYEEEAAIVVGLLLNLTR